MAIAIAVSLALAGAVPAFAQSDDATDLRCFVVASVLMNSSDRNQRAAGVIGSLYFMGRLDGRSPGLDWNRRLTAEMAAMSGSDLSAASAACGAIMTAQGYRMGAMSKRVQDHMVVKPQS
ncbi:MAG TPA: hypothetical protein VE309_07625 [Caulobacteraceae bacterium]|jgi:hypothetical protein|nr:hypothetical protein [Caulobacteraceae bacterium]